VFRATLLAVTLVTTAAQFVSAQVPALQIGATGGVAITTIVGDDIADAESRTSPFFGGALVFHPAASVFGFETGVLFVPNGASTDFDWEDAAR
jgi:hypothetical protein